MPQATQELRDEFDSDSAAFGVLGDNFYVAHGGVIKNKPSHKPTAQEFRALDYLFQEWDYEYHMEGVRD